MIENRRRAFAIAGALLAAAALLAVLVAIPATRHDVQTVDDATRRLAVRIQDQPTTAIAEGLSFLGGTWFDWAVRALAAVLLVLGHRFGQLIAFALAVATSEILIGTLKAAFGRRRPPGSLITTTGASFPSGHAIAAAVTALGVVLVLVSPGPARRRWIAFAVAFALVMALSRVYLRAHWLSDAVEGFFLGTGLAVGWPVLVQTVRDRRRTPVIPKKQEDTWENA